MVSGSIQFESDAFFDLAQAESSLVSSWLDLDQMFFGLTYLASDGISI